MGQAKKYMMEEEISGVRLPDEKICVCKKHFDDLYIRQYIDENSVYGVCDYCGLKTKVMQLSHFMEYVIEKIEKYFGDPENEGFYFKSLFYDDDEEVIKGLKRFGNFAVPEYAIQYDCKKDLLQDIELTTDNEKLNKEIEDCIIRDTWIQRDSYIMLPGQELSFKWQMFERMVKHEQRFTFFRKPEFSGEELSEDNNLMDILTELGIKISEHNLCREIDKGVRIFRCRVLNEGEVADSFEKVTSPPQEKAKQSRMSPAGVPMFYGAFDRNTAITECFPDGKGTSNNVVAKFKTKINLQILDLTNLPQSSFWMPSDWRVVEFLNSFNNKIIKPIERDDSVHIEYVPSQVFTEYLRYIYSPIDGRKINGIIYKSSLPGAKNNIVLFYDQSSSSNVLELEEIVPT